MKKLAAVLSAAAIAAGSLAAAPTASAGIRGNVSLVSRATCAVMKEQAALGATITGLDSLLSHVDHSSLDGDTLHVHITTQFKAGTLQAIKNWESASNGRIKFDVVDHSGDGIVEIKDMAKDDEYAKIANGIAYYVGESHPVIEINQNQVYADLDNQALTIGHEIGHQMGLAHGCDNTLMNAGNGRMAFTPTALDVQAVLQAPFNNFS